MISCSSMLPPGFNAGIDSGQAILPSCASSASHLDCEKRVEGSILQHRHELDDFLATIERKAFRIAELATRNRDDALEIVQDTMLKLVQKYASRPQDEWAPLFYRILNNRITDFYRRGAVKNRIIGWLGIFDADKGEYSNDMDLAEGQAVLKPDQQFETQNDCSRVSEALEELSPRQRQAFLLRAWQGLSVKETAFAMECSQGSVKTHYSRAIQALKLQLSGTLSFAVKG